MFVLSWWDRLPAALLVSLPVLHKVLLVALLPKKCVLRYLPVASEVVVVSTSVIPITVSPDTLPRLLLWLACLVVEQVAFMYQHVHIGLIVLHRCW